MVKVEEPPEERVPVRGSPRRGHGRVGPWTGVPARFLRGERAPLAVPKSTAGSYWPTRRHNVIRHVWVHQRSRLNCAPLEPPPHQPPTTVRSGPRHAPPVPARERGRLRSTSCTAVSTASATAPSSGPRGLVSKTLPKSLKPPDKPRAIAQVIVQKTVAAPRLPCVVRGHKS